MQTVKDRQSDRQTETDIQRAKKQRRAENEETERQAKTDRQIQTRGGQGGQSTDPNTPHLSVTAVVTSVT